MKNHIQKISLLFILIILIASVITFISANIILHLLWLNSQDVAHSIIKLLLVQWLSVPITALIFCLLSLLIFTAKKAKDNKMFLLFKLILVFCVMAFVEYRVNLFQAILNTLLGGFTGDIDPLTHLDMSFYIFWVPLLKKLSIFIICYNTLLLFLRGVYSKKLSFDILDKLILMKLLFFLGILISILRFEIIHSKMLNYIGYMDIYGDFLPLVISIFLIFIFLCYLILFENQKSKFTIISGFILSIFILSINFIWPIYLEKFIYTPNQSSLQEKFAGIHADSTRKSFALENIFSGLDYTVSEDQLSNVLENNFWQDASHFLKVAQRNQEVLPIFDIQQTTPILLSNNKGKFGPYFISSRESTKKDEELWDIKHFRNIFGYGAVIGAANKFNKEGYSCLVLKDLELNTTDIDVKMITPHIFFSESYNDYIFINTKMLLPNFNKERFPLEQQTFKDVKSIPINGFTKIILAIVYRDTRFLLTDYFTKDTQFIFRRNPKDIVKQIIPFFHYSDPRLTLINQELWWEMDMYTMVKSVFTSKTVDTPWGKYNWIRSPMKVFISAYSGKIIFDVMDFNNPFIRIIKKLYPQLIDNNIKIESEKYLYPIDLFDIQSQLLQVYHDTNTASFYSGFNQREISLGNGQTYKDSIKNRMILDKNRIAFQQTYTPKDKNIFSAQLIGYIDQNKKQKLYLYEAPASLGIPGLAQAQSFLNQDPEFSKISTLWGQIGSKLSTSDLVFYPMKDKGIYLGTVFLESEIVNTPLAAQYTVIDSTTISLGSSLDELFYNAINKLVKSQNFILSPEEQLRSEILKAYQDYLKAENSRINGNTQEYRENVDKIGASLQKMQSLF